MERRGEDRTEERAEEGARGNKQGRLSEKELDRAKERRVNAKR